MKIEKRGPLLRRYTLLLRCCIAIDIDTIAVYRDVAAYACYASAARTQRADNMRACAHAQHVMR